MSDYQRISCENHSIYELAIMRNQSIEVTIDGKLKTIQPKDIATKLGEEFLVFIDEHGERQTLRADKVAF
ncbi:MAG: hypothetical protein HN338_01850 [Candidatus Ruthia sp.]|jgi:transcriptional antiterminator Rof (Rho-off)|nr:hypothetical protein [Candidatus Ruthturnera sp.]MBT6922762.1 hypothetical protein [Candidatus Ruthturnera sp.]